MFGLDLSVDTLIIIFIAISLGSLAKGLIGIGLPLISIPILSSFLGVEHAVVVMTVPVFASNVWIVWSYRDLAQSVPGLKLALGMAAIGTIGGVYALANLDDTTLLYILTVWIALYLVILVLNPEFRLDGKAARRASPVLATCAGISQGATGISGPVISTWIHSYRLQNESYVFGVSVMFLAISTTHLFAVSGAGLMDQTRLIEGLIALIPTAIFVPIGMRLTRLVSAKQFNRLVIGIIVVMEIKLVWEGILRF